MIIGVIVALSAPSAIISYAIIFISGIFAGRLVYERKNKIQLPYLMIIAGFVIGYLIGVYYGSRKIVVLMFVLGTVLSYNLYEKEVIRDTRF